MRLVLILILFVSLLAVWAGACQVRLESFDPERTYSILLEAMKDGSARRYEGACLDAMCKATFNPHMRPIIDRVRHNRERVLLFVHVEFRMVMHAWE